ncbi:hypothetical protein QBC35DRAFT_383282 [Podospora australis]|uniref:Uncharacterized protein n=1 Tax=Podospora australis TaxID=1536484 RepID=A0AAN6WUX9_9PEZI|nr:hypothetical protein QBC35DRAFT_383282 [Podospora australis]
MIDRWIRYNGRTQVYYNYILANVVWECFRLSSTILFLWGTYTLAWRQFEHQSHGHVDSTTQKFWWFVSKVVLFAVSTVSLFYLIFYLAFSVTWLNSLSIVTVTHFAKRGSAFQIATSTLFLFSSIMSFVAYKLSGRRTSNETFESRLYMWSGILMLFGRSLGEAAVILKGASETSEYCTEASSASLALCTTLFGTEGYASVSTASTRMLETDIAYGLLSVFYLLSMWLLARQSAKVFDPDGTRESLVMSEIRFAILQMLEKETSHGKTQSPPFHEVLQEVSEKLEEALNNGPLASSLATLSPHYKRQAAVNCLEELARTYEGVTPRYGTDGRPKRAKHYYPEAISSPSAPPGSTYYTQGSSDMRSSQQPFTYHTEASTSSAPMQQSEYSYTQEFSNALQPPQGTFPRRPSATFATSQTTTSSAQSLLRSNPPPPSSSTYQPYSPTSTSNTSNPQHTSDPSKYQSHSSVSSTLPSHGPSSTISNSTSDVSKNLPPRPHAPNTTPAAASAGYRAAAIPRPTRGSRFHATGGLGAVPSTASTTVGSSSSSTGRVRGPSVVTTPYLAQSTLASKTSVSPSSPTGPGEGSPGFSMPAASRQEAPVSAVAGSGETDEYYNAARGTDISRRYG